MQLGSIMVLYLRGVKARINVFITLLFCTIPAYAAAPLHDKTTATMPIEVSALLLDIFRDKHEAIFTKHVVAKQGDMILHADYMRVEFSKEKTTQHHDIQHIYLRDHVVLERNGKYARAKQGEYVVKEEVLYLEEDVELHEDDTIVYGEYLVYNVKNDVATMKDPTQKAQKKSPSVLQRTRAFFTPKGS